MRREELYLADIVEMADAIEVSLRGVDHAAFLADRDKCDAVLLKLILIGEAAARLPKALRKHHPEVQWAEIITFRNMAVHIYFAVDWEFVWITASEDTPKLRGLVADILAKEFPDRLPFARGE
jgi:uncharacterized protein with HEPN domain